MSTPELAGTVALVTGASRGIGAAIGRRLARDGAAVAVTYRERGSAADEVVGSIASAGGSAAAFRADMANPDDIETLFRDVMRHFGRIDILVNNAGVAMQSPVDQMTAAQFDTLFAVNVRGVALAARCAAAAMRADGGSIVNISSGAATANPPGAGFYSASKAALESLTRTWATELGPRRIRVNAVAPGVTESEMLHGMFTPDLLDKLVARTPLGRLGQPEDIADVVAFLASPAARWITGQIVSASGGLR